MKDLLKELNQMFTKAVIPYQYGIWKGSQTYPYFVGSLQETNYRYEDNHSTIYFTISGWSRSSITELLEIGTQIKKLFRDLQIITNDKCFHIRYGDVMEIPTDVEGLYRIDITLNIDAWEGE